MERKYSLENKLGVSIVNFNAGDFLLQCLKSLDNQKEVGLDVWVVDNGSTDGSLERAKQVFPNLHYITNGSNLGFAKAHNLVLKNLKTDYILILNPDVKVLPGTLKSVLDFMDNNSEIGIASCRVVQEDGKIDLASHRGFPTPWAAFLYFVMGDGRLYHLTDRDMNKPHEVDAVSGAFLMTKRSVLDEIGLFDEDYFMYAEDIDLCYRAKKAGLKVMYLPQVSVVHFKGISSGIKKHTQDISQASLYSRKKALDAFYQTMEIFYKKHLAEEYPVFINWLVYLGINLKWALAKRGLKV